MSYMTNFTAIVCAAVAGCAAPPRQDFAIMVHGRAQSCASIGDLNEAIDSPTSGYFDGWDQRDFQAAQSWSLHCQPPELRNRANGKLVVIANRLMTEQRQEQIRIAASQRKKDIDEDAAIRAKQEADKRRADEEFKRKQEDAYNECRSGKAGKLYAAEDAVINARESMAFTRQKISEEKRTVAVSGVRDLGWERALGQELIQGTDTLSQAFSEYKQAGGKAKSASSVKMTTKEDPCEGIKPPRLP